MHIALFLLLALTLFATPKCSDFTLPDHTTQLLVVTSKDWNTSTAQLTLFEKNSINHSSFYLSAFIIR